MYHHQRIRLRKKQPDIVIVGGGAAGIAAATQLLQHGFNNIKIIEAENRLGGRVNTVPLGASMVDLGAHWVHGETGNIVYEIADSLKLLEHSGDFANVQFVFSNATELSRDLGMTIKEHSGNILDDIDTLNHLKGSVYDYLVERCKEVGSDILPDAAMLEAYINWLVKFQCTIDGCDSLKEVSAKGLNHYKQCPGDPLVNWKLGGYSSIVDILQRKHQTKDFQVDLSDKVIFNNEVKEVDWSGLHVLVKCLNGQTYSCDHVIVTVSLGVLKEKYQSLFNPSLPDLKRRAITGLGIGTVNKIYLRFPYVWWPPDCSGFSLLWLEQDKYVEKGHYSWEVEIIGFYTEHSSPLTLTAWLIGEAAREMETYKLDQVKEACYRVLNKFLSHKFTIPAPLEVKRSSWFSNPHFRGSYSFRSLNTDALQTSADDLAEPLANGFGKDVVFFAGEATHNHFYSTVHGAIETGWREALRIINLYDPKSEEKVK